MHAAFVAAAVSLRAAFVVRAACTRPAPRAVRVRRARARVVCAGAGGGGADGDERAGELNEMDEWVVALEGLFLEALLSYYSGAPMFDESEFQTLREELDHLGRAQIRLGAMEKVWVQATSARDFDRRIRDEFCMSEEELGALKKKLLKSGRASPPTRPTAPGARLALPSGKSFVKDAQRLDSGERVDERLKWYVFAFPGSALWGGAERAH